MRWLNLKRSERRWWSTSAILVAVGMVLGVIGVAPALADLEEAYCFAEPNASTGLVSMNWDGVAEGLELVVLWETVDHRLIELISGTPGNVIGHGSSGSWSGTAAPMNEAFGYHLWSPDPDQGGDLRCAMATIDGPNGPGAGEPPPEPTVTPVVTPGPDGQATTGAPNIAASITIDCSVNEVVVTLTNSGDAPGEAVVTIDGTTDVVTVAAQDTTMVSQAITPASDVSVTVVVGDTTVGAQQESAACETAAPVLSAAAAMDCAAEHTRVTVSNTGTLSGSVLVELGGELLTTLTVNPGETVTHNIPFAGGGSGHLVVHDGQTVLVDQVIEPDCVDPTPVLMAEIAYDCSLEQLTVSVTNVGLAPGSAQVIWGDEIQFIEVPAGATVAASYAGPISAGTMVEIVGPGIQGQMTLASLETPSCVTASPDLSAKIITDCASGLIRVAVTNAGDLAGTADVTVGEDVASAAVSPGEIVELTFDLPTAETTVVVSSAGEILVSETVSAAVCVPGEVALVVQAQADCDVDEMVVTIDNPSNTDTSATVFVDDQTTQVVAVAGESTVVRLPIGNGLDAEVSVNVAGEQVWASTVPTNCDREEPEQPTAQIEVSCVLDRASLLLTNHTEGEVTFSVIVNNVPNDVVVAAGSSGEYDIDLVEGTHYEIIVSALGEVVLESTFDHVCAPPPTPAPPPSASSSMGTLPVTGANPALLVSAGLTLLAAGGAALNAARVRAERLAEA